MSGHSGSAFALHAALKLAAARCPKLLSAVEKGGAVLLVTAQQKQGVATVGASSNAPLHPWVSLMAARLRTPSPAPTALRLRASSRERIGGRSFPRAAQVSALDARTIECLTKDLGEDATRSLLASAADDAAEVRSAVPSVTPRRDGDGAYIVHVRHGLMEAASGTSHDDGATAAAMDVNLDGVQLDEADGGALHALQRRLLKVVTGTEIDLQALGVGRGTAVESGGAVRTVLIDLCPVGGFEAAGLATAASTASEDHMRHATRRTMVALQLVAPILHRDACVLARVPSDPRITKGLYTGVRDVFSECQYVVDASSTGDGTRLLLARRSHRVAATSGVVKRGWELYHRKSIVITKARQFPGLGRPQRAQEPTKYFTQTLRSRNLELAPPAQVARKQLSTLHEAIARGKDTEVLNNLANHLPSDEPL